MTGPSLAYAAAALKVAAGIASPTLRERHLRSARVAVEACRGEVERLEGELARAEGQPVLPFGGEP